MEWGSASIPCAKTVGFKEETASVVGVRPGFISSKIQISLYRSDKESEFVQGVNNAPTLVKGDSPTCSIGMPPGSDGNAPTRALEMPPHVQSGAPFMPGVRPLVTLNQDFQVIRRPDCAAKKGYRNAGTQHDEHETHPSGG